MEQRAWFTHSPETHHPKNGASFVSSEGEGQRNGRRAHGEMASAPKSLGVLHRYMPAVLHAKLSGSSLEPSVDRSTSRELSEKEMDVFFASQGIALEKLHVEPAQQKQIADLRKHAQERGESPVRALGFQESFGIPNEAITQLLLQTYPKTWTDIGSVESVRVSKELREQQDGVRAAAVDLFTHGQEASHEIVLDPQLPIEELSQILHRSMVYTNRFRGVDFTQAPGKRLLYDITHRSQTLRDFSFFSDIQCSSQDALSVANAYWSRLLSKAYAVSGNTKEEWLEALAERLFDQSLSVSTNRAYDPSIDTKLVGDYTQFLPKEFVPWQAASLRDHLIESTRSQQVQTMLSEEIQALPKEIAGYFQLFFSNPSDYSKQTSNSIEASHATDRAQLQVCVELLLDQRKALNGLLASSEYLSSRDEAAIAEIRDRFHILRTATSTLTEEEHKSLLQKL